MRNSYWAFLSVMCIAAVLAMGLAVPEPSLTAQVSSQTVEKSEKLREWEKQQEKVKNKQRHDDLKKDTDKLLQLATDLKLAVDKSNEQTLSMDVIKKAEEVEKLAKNIQRKMKGD